MFFHEFRTPIPVRVLEPPACRPDKWPSGKALAYGFFLLHFDYHLWWLVCFDEGGTWWAVENPWVRGDPHPTHGRFQKDREPDRGQGPGPAP